MYNLRNLQEASEYLRNNNDLTSFDLLTWPSLLFLYKLVSKVEPLGIDGDIALQLKKEIKLALERKALHCDAMLKTIKHTDQLKVFF